VTKHPSAQANAKTLSLALLTSVFVSCASNPDKIDAAYVSSLKYEAFSCTQIALEIEAVEFRTDTLYQELRKTRRADNWQAGVGILLLPTLFALEGGDGVEASEYAFLKGDYEALQQASTQKLCGLQSRSPEQQIEDALTADTLIPLPNNRQVSLSQMIGLLESAYAQGIITEQELQEAQETAFMLLGSTAGELTPGALDKLYAIINKTDIGMLAQLETPEDSPRTPSQEQSMPSQDSQVAMSVATHTQTPISQNAPAQRELMQRSDDSEDADQTLDAKTSTKSVAAILQDFHHLKNLDVDELPRFKLLHFLEKAGLPSSTPILGFIDTSVLRSGKHGVLFAQEGIYYTNDFVAGAGGTYFISYEDVVMHAAPLHKGRYFYLGIQRLPKHGLIDFVGAGTDLEEFSQLILEIKSNYELQQEYFAGNL
jgi:hypothetical protein